MQFRRYIRLRGSQDIRNRINIWNTYTSKWINNRFDGAISFGNENLTTTGTIAAGDDSVIGNLTLRDGSITDSQEQSVLAMKTFHTTGTISAERVPLSVTLHFSDGSITDSGGHNRFWQ